jgi:hypothetical protein
VKKVLEQIGTPVMVSKESEITTLVSIFIYLFVYIIAVHITCKLFVIDWYDCIDYFFLCNLCEYTKMVCH